MNSWVRTKVWFLAPEVATGRVVTFGQFKKKKCRKA